MHASSPEREAVERAILRAVRDFGDAHDRMSSGMKLGMDMNITDIATLRLLIIREEQGRTVTPADIARHLRISTASTAKLIDRLTASGHVRREPHPTDRRARSVLLTPAAKAEFFRLFGERLSAMRTELAAFADEDLEAAARVLDALGRALDPEGAGPDGPVRLRTAGLSGSVVERPLPGGHGAGDHAEQRMR